MAETEIVDVDIVIDAECGDVVAAHAVTVRRTVVVVIAGTAGERSTVAAAVVVDVA